MSITSPVSPRKSLTDTRLLLFITSMLLLLIIIACKMDAAGAYSQTAVFKKTLLRGQYVTHTNNKLSTSLEECGLQCFQSLSKALPYIAFRYHPTGNVCYLYTQSRYKKDEYEYVYFWKDEFQTISVRGQNFRLFVSKFKMHNDASRVRCGDVGGRLLEFDSLDKYEAVRLATAGDSLFEIYFIGANDKDTEGHWVTNSGGLPLNESLWRWADGAPWSMKDNHDCMAILQSYTRVYDTDCNANYKYICEPLP